MDKRATTALVTGATGFVGSHVARRLVAGGMNVHLLLRPASSLEAVTDLVDRVTIHRHSNDVDALLVILDRAKPDIVFHLSTYFHAEHKPQDIAPMVASNVQFPAELLEVMTRSGCRLLVNAGTAWQHFKNEDYNPVCFHAATKQAFEAIVTYYAETRGLRTITLKLHDTYGPGDRRRKLFHLLRETTKNGAPLAMSPGNQKLDLTFASDVAEAFWIAGQRLLGGKNRAKHESFVIETREHRSLRKVAALYAEVTGTKLAIVWGGRPYREREVMAPWTKGRTIPGWKPKVRLREGIRLMEMEKEGSN